MLDVEEKLNEFENCIRRFNKADEIIFMLLTNNKQSATLSGDFEKVRRIVHELKDESLSALYNKIMEKAKTSNLYSQLYPSDYFAFLQRVGTLLSEITIQTNAADISLREVLGLPSDMGLWGSKRWRPSGQL